MEVEEVGKNHYLVQGFVEIDFLNDEYEMNLPEGDYETIAGLIIEKLEKIPRHNTKLTVNKWNITILQVSNVKILKLEMKYIGDKKA